MRVAFLTDVHGNLPALEAVLEHAAARGVKTIWNGGDYVGYGPFPEECVRRLRDRESAGVVGNYDRKVLRVPRKIEKWRRRKHPLKALAFAWTYECLSEVSRVYLARLPQHHRAAPCGVETLVVHATVMSDNETIGPGTTPKRWAELDAAAQAALVLCGHRHVPFHHRTERGLVVCPGSVGRPDDGDPRAGYAMVEFGTELPDDEESGHERGSREQGSHEQGSHEQGSHEQGSHEQESHEQGCHEPGSYDEGVTIAGRGFVVRLYRVAYDIERTAAEVRRQGLPDDFAQMFREGRNLKAVLGDVE